MYNIKCYRFNGTTHTQTDSAPDAMHIPAFATPYSITHTPNTTIPTP